MCTISPAAHPDVLTRLPSLFPPSTDSANKATLEAPARHLAKYLFPRQFGMHNVFTSPKAKTAFEVLPDYLDREVEIKVTTCSAPALSLQLTSSTPHRDWVPSRPHRA